MSTRRARRASINRDTQRKVIKGINRIVRIECKIRDLLEKCPCSIIDDKQLTEEECETLRGFVMTETQFDYYPIPKVLHNRIRKYVHDHPRIGAEGSLLYALIYGRFVTFNPQSAADSLDALRAIDYSVSIPMTHAPITPTFL